MQPPKGQAYEVQQDSVSYDSPLQGETVYIN